MIQLLKKRSTTSRLAAHYSTSIDRVSHRGVHRQLPQLQVGQHFGKFQLSRLLKVPHTCSTLFQFTHPSGLAYYHIDAPSVDNSFAILVKSTPLADDSANYVLEKLLQCGCKKYRVKDAIREMKNRSFNSCDAVETTDQYLSFPFRTHIAQDFYNLMDVYFHMVFAPELMLKDFLTTRGRFSFQNQNSSNELQFVGDVYTEALTSEQLLDRIMQRAIQKQLFSQQYSSLGRSNELMKLTLEKVQQHHKEHFTLSNTVLFSHGDLSPLAHMDKISEHVEALGLDAEPRSAGNSQKQEPEAQVPDLPKTITVDHLQPYWVFMLSYKLPAELPFEDTARLQLLSYLLFDLPDSPFQRWLSQSLPYPKLYGMKGDTFNIGFCVQQQISSKQVIEFERTIHEVLKQLAESGFPDALVELCINHLEASAYGQDGLQILEGISMSITSSAKQLEGIFNMPQLLRKLQRDLKKTQVFGDLIKKYLLNNQHYLRVVGRRNPELTEQLVIRNKEQLERIKAGLTAQQKKEIIEYQPPTGVQDPSRLPLIQVSDFQFLEETAKEVRQVAGVNITFVSSGKLPSITIRFDITDLEQEYLNCLEIYCKALPTIGYRGIDQPTYEAFMDRFVHNVELSYRTQKESDGLKLFMFMKVEFLQRNTEFAFNIINGLINRPNFANLSKLSTSLREQTSNLFDDVCQRFVEYGVGFASSSHSPYLRLEDPSFHARAACSAGVEMLKVTNPKKQLQQLSHKLQGIHKKLQGLQRMEVFVDCPNSHNSVIGKYLDLVLNSIPKGTRPGVVNTASFPASKLKVYLPNFSQGYVFESFATSYMESDSPAVAVLSALIDQGMRNAGADGGCVSYKGSLTAFLKGDKKQFIELQQFYFNSGDLDVAKRRLFQRYRQHNPLYEFEHGINSEGARFYKQAVLATSAKEVDDARSKYIEKAVKEERSNLVIMGEHLQSYDALLKTGWTVQRLLDETSLNMESSEKNPRALIEQSKYWLLG